MPASERPRRLFVSGGLTVKAAKVPLVSRNLSQNQQKRREIVSSPAKGLLNYIVLWLLLGDRVLIMSDAIFLERRSAKNSEKKCTRAVVGVGARKSALIETSSDYAHLTRSRALISINFIARFSRGTSAIDYGIH